MGEARTPAGLPMVFYMLGKYSQRSDRQLIDKEGVQLERRGKGWPHEGSMLDPLSVPDAATDPTLAVGDHYRVALTLDDAARTSHVVPMRICHVDGKAIGAVFADDMPYSHELDFYLSA